jgi:CRP-like cAMP-binding protein
MTIKEEGGVDEASDAIKKIILNFFQIVSLAAGLPLQWPPIIISMFEFMASFSSAGGSLLIPDCELTHLQAADAFYLKQMFYTFVVPIVIVVCLVAWTLIWCVCRRASQKRCPQKFSHVKNYAILSIVLMLFLVYPMMVKLCLSMLKCPFVGKTRYLMGDLQEECFVGRHLSHVLLLTAPQFMVVVVGLPLMGLCIILRSTSEERLKKNFHMRYGLLYLGYRDERSWWEIVIVVRKICVVSIATFGTLMGRVDVQVFIALGIVFLSIVVHLLGQPFDIATPKGKLLHLMEFSALSVAWCTFWGGLMFYILTGAEYDAAKTGMTVLLVLTNVTFLLVSMFPFMKEFIKDVNKKKEKRKSQLSNHETHVVPVRTPEFRLEAVKESIDTKLEEEKEEEEKEEDEDFNHETSIKHRRKNSVHTEETQATAHEIHSNFHESEMALKAKHQKKQQRQRRSTQNRVMARLKIRQTKALNRVPLFASIPHYRLATAIESILELTTYKKAFKNDVLCRQGEPANEFYIIVSGQCSVKVQVQEEEGKTPQERKVGTLKELDFFGESALVPGEHTRNATVVVDTEAVQVLMLSRKNFELLVAEEIINHDVVANVEQESERRKEMTRSRSTISRNFELPKGRPPVPTGKPPPPPPKMRPKLTGGSGGVKGGVDL